MINAVDAIPLYYIYHSLKLQFSSESQLSKSKATKTATGVLYKKVFLKIL